MNNSANNIIYSGCIYRANSSANIIYNSRPVGTNIIYNTNTDPAKYSNINTHNNINTGNTHNNIITYSNINAQNNKVSECIIRYRPIINSAIKYIKLGIYSAYSDITQGLMRMGQNGYNPHNNFQCPPNTNTNIIKKLK